MKKILLATTAIVAVASVSSTASAADKIALSLGGFMNQYVGLTKSDDAANSVTEAMVLGQRASTEIYFRGATTLDNGLSVSVDVQREGDKGAGGTADISSLTVSSDAMGALTLGGTGHAADDFAVSAPMAGALDFGDSGDWATATVGAGFNGSAVRDLGGKELKIKYVSPTFSGVTVGISYDAAANVNGNKGDANRSTTDDASSIAMMYEGEISGASVSADIARFHNNADNQDTVLFTGTAAGNNAGSDTTTDRFGLNVGMAGFTVGGSYNDINDAAANADGKAWELGVSYETGPYAVSAAYMTGTLENGATTEAKTTEWVLGASYDLGASVALVGNYFSKKGSNNLVPGTADSKVSGLVAGIEVGF